MKKGSCHLNDLNLVSLFQVNKNGRFSRRA
nr:MAG TPA: hypothetical protein [Caudoviricetes sp.]